MHPCRAVILHRSSYKFVANIVPHAKYASVNQKGEKSFKTVSTQHYTQCTNPLGYFQILYEQKKKLSIEISHDFTIFIYRCSVYASLPDILCMPYI